MSKMPLNIWAWALKANMDTRYMGTYCYTNDGGQQYTNTDQLREKIEGMRRSECNFEPQGTLNDGFNDALAEVLKLLGGEE